MPSSTNQGFAEKTRGWTKDNESRGRSRGETTAVRFNQPAARWPITELAIVCRAHAANWKLGTSN